MSGAVLIIEETPRLRDAVRPCLRAAGYWTLHLPDLEMALAALTAVRVALIVDATRAPGTHAGWPGARTQIVGLQCLVEGGDRGQADLLQLAPAVCAAILRRVCGG